ncbi:MAG: ATP-binding protein [Candidatus Methanoperedens sp.]|nr:ATP-binding protein [Candidatus Methanoperedens sp.]
MYVEREINEHFKKVANIYNIIAVVGARQAGKTTFLKEKAKEFNSSYLFFDDPDVRGLFNDDIKKFEIQYLENHNVTVLDEVQYCKDAGIKLKYLADKGKKIWITSSSEIILGTEILSYLVGRVSIIRLYPFSLREFLLAKGQKEVTHSILERSIWEHITYGGYPRVVMNNDTEIKKIILKDLYDTMVLKDVAMTFSIEDIRTLEVLIKYLSVNVGGIVSYENISRDIKISFQTLKKYLDALEKSYVIIRLSPFYTNKTKEITKQPKIYFVDTGLRNVIAKSFPPEMNGLLFENYILLELIKMGFSPKYWRTKSKTEVDFLIEKENITIPIEVKINAEVGNVKRSMRSFIDYYRPDKAIVVAYKCKKGEMNIEGCTVIFTDVQGMRDILLL